MGIDLSMLPNDWFPKYVFIVQWAHIIQRFAVMSEAVDIKVSEAPT